MMQGYVRIIGGKWRGKRLAIPTVQGLRPTPDRVRETVFNWLQPYIAFANCLDLFTGSGAFGLEALSRGASFVTLVDDNQQVILQLTKHVESLGATEKALLYRANLPEEYRIPQKPFDIVFIDPPYGSYLLLPTCFMLEKLGFLADSSHVYLEAGCLITNDQLPSNWTIVKAKKAGAVMYHLAKREKVT